MRIAPCPARQGTNLLFVPRGVRLRAQFGAGSRAAHLAAYGVHVCEAAPTPDVDTPADVQWLRENLGRAPDLAPSTRRVLASLPAALPAATEVLALLDRPLPEILDAARAVRDQAFGNQITYSRKVFVPVTHLCRDVCHYCTFARTLRQLSQLYMSEEQVLEVARHGAQLGCREALIGAAGRVPYQRTTLYGRVAHTQAATPAATPAQ